MARNPIFAIIWLVLLFFLAWPIAAACAGPFEACFHFIKDITNFLEKLITWPRDCGRAIGDCSTRCPTPF
ncbi:hypothetical protein ACHAWU_001089 [Discostella pseudostelligera]|uniref:Uncharacterized protein n=1 Tax=Discostella pseudostelligera TaxID=259834 RepID=A0ABD3MH83_9STRA